jgi:hypothetical protein
MGSFNGISFRLSIELTQDGADVDYQVATNEVGVSAGGGGLGTVAGRTFGAITSLSIDQTTNLDQVAIGHLSVHDAITNILDLWQETAAHVGEKAGRRVERLCDEEGITFESIGDLDGTAAMGAQRPNTLIALLRGCQQADLGMLYESRRQLAVGYRTLSSLYNQPPRLTLPAADLVSPPEPVDVGREAHNSITVTRTGGSEYTAELTTGRLSVQAPPNGIGRHPQPVEVNLRADEQLPDHAGFRLHRETVDEPLYQDLETDAADDGLTSDQIVALLGAEAGDRIVLTGLPPQVPPDDVSVIVQGYEERLGSFEHTLTANCSPGSVYEVGVYGSDHYDTAGSELGTGVSSSATSLTVATTSGPVWTQDAADMPFDIRCGGERMTVTAISGASSPQTFTVTRSVNDVNKAHSAGAAVSLWSPAAYAL